jgi:hypothetical protein
MLSPAGANEGSVWAEVNSFIATGGLNLEGTSEGFVYATGYDALSATLYWWDDGAGNFMVEQNFPTTVDHRPMLGPGMLEDRITFGVWDDAAGTLKRLYGKHGAYDPPDIYAIDANPVWEGVFSAIASNGGFFCLAAGSHDQPGIFFNPPGSSYSDLLCEPLISDEESPFDKPSLAGRLVDAAACFDTETLVGNLSLDLLVANGATFHPTRFRKSLLGGDSSEDLPLGAYSPYTEFRRSVSATTVSGLTAVEVVATVDGEETYFGWSNYGDWESLPLPDGLDGMTQPLILCGNDGRWHIIYKNWKDDSIMIRSSL